MDFNVDEYYKNYDNYEYNIVYNYNGGGLGDFMKFYKECFTMCFRYRVKIHMLHNNKLVHNFVKLIHKNTYITNDELKKNKVHALQKMEDIDNMVSGVYYMLVPSFFYMTKINKGIKNDILYKDLFYFDEVIINNVNNVLNVKLKDYVAIHLRMGDSHLETDNKFIYCKKDSRSFTPLHI